MERVSGNQRQIEETYMPDIKLNFVNASNANQTIVVFVPSPNQQYGSPAWEVLQIDRKSVV